MKMLRTFIIILLFLTPFTLVTAYDMTADVKEIETIKGEQSFLYIVGGKDLGILEGMSAKIYNSRAEVASPIGECEVISVYSKLSRLKILSQSEKITFESYVLFDRGEVEELLKERALKRAIELEEEKREDAIRRRKEEERRKVQAEKWRQHEIWSRTFSIFKYDGSRYCLLRRHSPTRLKVGQLGVINGNSGTHGGSGQVKIVKIFKNALLVRLLQGTYITSTDTKVYFEEEIQYYEKDSSEEWNVATIKSIEESQDGTLNLVLGGVGHINIRPDSTLYVYNDLTLKEKSAELRYSQGAKITKLLCPINHDGVVLWQERLPNNHHTPAPDFVEKVPALIGLIKEREVVDGKSYLYITLGKSKKDYKVGLYGYLYADSAKSRRIGKIKVIEVYSNLSKVEIVFQKGEMGKTAIVEVEVDPRYLIE